MRTASVPDWVAARCDAVAVAAYVQLDLNDGRGSQNELVESLGVSQRLVRRALIQLEDQQAIRASGRARYELRRVPPSPDFSTESTELCTGPSTGETAAGTAPLLKLAEFSTDQSPSTTTREGQGEITPAVLSPAAPKLVLVDVPGSDRPQNLGFNALAEACNADPRSRAGEITAALKKIRQFAWEELQEARARGFSTEPHDGIAFERYLAAMIHGNALLYKSRMRGATLTPTALAKWWFDLEKLPVQGLTPEQIASGDWES